jgi:hypothetical protein
MRLYLKNTQHKRADRVAQLVEHLLSKCEALISNTGTTKNFFLKIYLETKDHLLNRLYP